MNTTPDKVYEEVDELRNEDLARVPKGIEYALENGILRVNAGLDGKVTAKATVYTTAPEEEVEYKYNHEGLRIQKRHKKRSGEETVTEYMLHGKLVAHEKIRKKKGDGSEEAHEIHFFYDRDSRPELMVYDGEIYYYIKNQQGDIVEIVDADGSAVVEYGYDAWGKNIYTKGSKAEGVGKDNPFRYRGYVYDEETELYYVESRYYDPEFSRFVSPDTTDVLMAAPMALTDKNLFAYCDNNPIMRFDQGGEFWDTFLDVLSLASSIAEVVATPTSVTAWVGLAADVACLVTPGLTGGGAIVKAATKSNNVIDAAKDIYRAADKSSDIRKATGSYEIL